MSQKKVVVDGVANSPSQAKVYKEGPVKINLPVFKPKNECNVIKII